MKQLCSYGALTALALTAAFACRPGTPAGEDVVTAPPVPPAAAAVALFKTLSTFKVSGAVAEIVTASPDEKTLVYTDSKKQEIGFVNASDPAALKQIGVLAMGGEPTSVAYSRDGKHIFAVVAGPNELNVVDSTTRKIIRRIPLGGQPDCIAVSPDGRFAAIAIENERGDMDAAMPQLPAGYVVVVSLSGVPTAWTTKKVTLAGRPGLRFPTDPEPEFIDIRPDNRAAVTLQENNAIALINLQTGAIESTFSCGTVTHAADTVKDGKVDFTGQIKDARREPDAIGWTRAGNLLTANEGDYDTDLGPGQFTGGRGFSVFAPSGKLLYDVEGGLEQEASKAGLYPDKRSEKKGTEPEGVEITRFAERDLALITLERANAVAVYDITADTAPLFVQLLPTGDAPEGVLALSKRNLFLTANEGNGTLSVFGAK